MSLAFQRLAVVSAATKRKPVPDPVTGKQSGPVTHIVLMKCTRPCLADDAKELRETYKLESLVNVMQTFVQGHLDIVTGDTLIFLDNETKEYPIRILQLWPFGPTDVRKRLIYEDIQGQ